MFKSKDIILLAIIIIVFVLCLRQINLGLPHAGIVDYAITFSLYFIVILMPLGSAAMFYNRLKKTKTNC